MRSRALLFPTFLAVSSMLAGCGGGDADPTGTGGTGGTGGSGATGGTASTGGTGGSGATGGTGGSSTGGGGSDVIGGDRPVKMYIPPGYDGSSPAPLLVLLHGYGASGLIQEAYFKLHPLTEERGWIYAVADGTFDTTDKRFWNATDACCDFGNTGVDDSGYLSGVVDQIKAQYNVDPKRVYFVGHSNGGFMSYRMACDHADQIAAIVSLAGETFFDDADCNPSEPVAVAQIQGTMDETVSYTGGKFGAVSFPGAQESAEKWAGYDGCALTFTDGGTLDLESSLAGEETTVSVYDSGCQPGGHAELWTIQDGTHIPGLSNNFGASVLDFLEAHPKP